MYELPKPLLNRVHTVARKLRDRDLMGYQGKLSERSRRSLLEALNALYWNRTDLPHSTKDELRALYSEVNSLKEVQAVPPSRPKTPNARPSREDMRQKILDIQRRQQQRRQGSPEVLPMDLKDQLIKLGHMNPELRDDIRPILDQLEAMPKEADAFSQIRSLGKKLRAGGTVFVDAVMKQDVDTMRAQAYTITYAMGVMFSALGYTDEARKLKQVASSLR
jgi:hypothetical protein